jgi:hypothetical protein
MVSSSQTPAITINLLQVGAHNMLTSSSARVFFKRNTELRYFSQSNRRERDYFTGTKSNTNLPSTARKPTSIIEHVLSVNPQSSQPVKLQFLIQTQNNIRPACELGTSKFCLAFEFRLSLLRNRDDAFIDASLRPGSAGNHLPRFTQTSRRDDCSWDSDK